MKTKLFLTLFFSLFTGFSVLFGQGVTIYGYRNYQGAIPQTYIAGPVKFSLDNLSNITLLQDQTHLGRVYAGEYLNYKWYAVGMVAGTQSSPENLMEIDLLTGNRKVIAHASLALYDLTYDYTTQTMFGILSTGASLGKINLQTGSVTKIADLPTDIYALAIACDLTGQLFIVSTDDKLYKIDKTTAACLLVGSLGVDASYSQSMGFDHNTGVLYWNNAANYKLYTINTTTGSATLLGNIGLFNDNISSIFVPYTHVTPGAPDRVTNREAHPDATGANKATLSWTYPGKDVQGNSLLTSPDPLTKIHIYRDALEVATLTLSASSAGQNGTWEDNTVTAGKHFYRFICENAKGLGGVDDEDIMVYVGNDIPGAVGNFTVQQGDHSALLSWTKPTVGGTSGYFDPQSITEYKVFRSGTTAAIATLAANATTYEDVRPQNTFAKYSYTIYAVNATGNGVSVTSPEIMIKPSGWIIMDDGTYTVSEGTFYDSGGPSGNYKNNERITMTLIPEDPNAIFEVEFTAFNIEKDGSDKLIIYDGTTVDAPSLGAFNGTLIPSQLSHFYSSGALTFYFTSDVMTAAPGWTAKISSHIVKNKDLYVSKLGNPGYAIVGEELQYPVTVRNLTKNAVAASSYTLQLIDENNAVIASLDGLALAPLEEKTVSIPYTPGQEGSKTIKAFASFSGDEDPNNNTSNEVVIKILPEHSQWTSIGTKASRTGMYPISFFNSHSFSQFLFPSTRVLNGNTSLTEGNVIRAITYPLSSSTNSYHNFDIKVWMSETDLTDMSGGNIPVTGMTLVYDGKSDLNNDESEWSVFLTNPFHYTGKNLIISITRDGSNTADYDVYFYYTVATGIQYGWAINGPTAINPDVVLDSWRFQYAYPDINFLFTPDNNTGIKTPDASRLLSVYPNPVREVLHLNGVEKGSELWLTDIAGKTVVHTIISDNSLDVSTLSGGIYLLKVKTREGAVLQNKIIKR